MNGKELGKDWQLERVDGKGLRPNSKNYKKETKWGEGGRQRFETKFKKTKSKSNRERGDGKGSNSRKLLRNQIWVRRNGGD